MKIKTSELTGKALDWAVSKIIYTNPVLIGSSKIMIYKDVPFDYQPSTNWAQGGPIIEREGIEVLKGNPLYFPKGNEKGDFYEPLWIAGKQHGTTPLIAAMRCYVTSKLGDEVEVPD